MRHLVFDLGSRSPLSRVTRGPLAALLVFAAVTAHGRPALAAPDDAEAEALISRGIDLREHGKDDEALAVFKKALAKSPSPRARAQVALAEQALGLWVAAENDLVLALAADSDAWIAKNRGALEGALAVVRRHIGSLEVRGTDGAEVMLDGVRLGVLPRGQRVSRRGRTAHARAARQGLSSERARHRGPRGRRRSRDGHARRAASPRSPARGTGASRRRSSRGPARETPIAIPAAASGSSAGRSRASGARCSSPGGVGMLVRKGIVDDYNDRCPGLGVGQPADCDGKIDSARTWLTVSIVSLIAGGVFALGRHHARRHGAASRLVGCRAPRAGWRAGRLRTFIGAGRRLAGVLRLVLIA